MTPRATYRFQLRAEFPLTTAAEQLDYLAHLGVSHAYLSPPLQAAAGSAHGYDGVDPTRVSDDLGGEAARRHFVATLREHGLGQVVDIVPNHLTTADPANRWWWDVLRNGQASVYARHFDVDWAAPDPELTGKVVIPVLGQPLAEELAAGTIRLAEHGGERVVEYYDNRFPVADGTDDGASVANVLSRQNYLLTFWRDGLQKLTHRRFFDVTTLVGLRVEDEPVFADVHGEVLRWHGAGEVDGLRVDHPDGLADPTGYVQRLAAAAPGAWIVVEKILEPGEELRDDWPVGGTTGYDALNSLTGILVDGMATPALTAAYADAVSSDESFDDTARRSRLQMVRGLLAPELDRVTSSFSRIVDAPRNSIRALVEAFVAELPVYRTYVVPGTPASAADREAVATALQRLRDHHRDVDDALAKELAAVLLERAADVGASVEVREFARQLQQLSGPAMAKGVEDTAFYRYTRFIAANEVGGDPQHLGDTVDAFHETNARRAERWPTTMVSTSTHDTKRSEDVRARLAVLAEMPDEWVDVQRRWVARTADWWAADAPGVPRDPALEVLIHQTLVGAHPLPPERAHPYLDKAMREAKTITSWLDQHAGFEAAAHALLDRLLTDPEHRRELDALMKVVLVPGRINALTQKLLALTVPGVPDIYQGTELWSLDLVDPDNRRPVDYSVRRSLLRQVAEPGAGPGGTLADPADPGIAKMLVVHRALATRRDHTAAFLGPTAGYRPLTSTGTAADHVVAFERGTGEARVVTVAPRLPLTLARAGGWRDTRIDLAGGRWHDVLSSTDVTGGDVLVSELTERFPMALLVRT